MKLHKVLPALSVIIFSQISFADGGGGIDPLGQIIIRLLVLFLLVPLATIGFSVFIKWYYNIVIAIIIALASIVFALMMASPMIFFIPILHLWATFFLYFHAKRQDRNSRILYFSFITLTVIAIYFRSELSLLLTNFVKKFIG